METRTTWKSTEARAAYEYLEGLVRQDASQAEWRITRLRDRISDPAERNAAMKREQESHLERTAAVRHQMYRLMETGCERALILTEDEAKGLSLPPSEAS